MTINHISALQRILLGAFALTLCVDSAQALPPAPAYQLVILDRLPGYFNSEAQDVSSLGQVAGRSYSHSSLETIATRWTGATPVSVPAGNATADAINDLGHIVGVQITGSGTQTHGYFFNGTTVVDIHNSVLATVGNFSTALAINNSDRIVGFAASSPAGTRAAYLRNAGSTILLGTLGGDESSAYAINSAGIVAGSSETANGNTRAMTWSDVNGNNASDPGEMVQLADLGLSSAANAINDANQAAGFVLSPAFNRQPALWNNASAFIPLPLLPGAVDGEAFDVNNLGAAVGVSTGGVATLWQSGQALNLNDLVAPGSGYTLIRANGINDQGWIVGEAIVPGVHARGFLLIPVPEPAAISLLASLIVASAARRSRRIEIARRFPVDL